MSITALDLFAGTGWGVALQRLGVPEVGVELMPEAIATRAANGMRTAFTDVWQGIDDPTLVPPHDLLIASPPCQTFSMAGSGAGRAALDEVLGLIDSRAYLDPLKLRAFGERHDPRTALVLTPLTYVAEHVPTYVVLEQVPPVLPVWERIADELRAWGYSVATGLLHAEQYGVPQTRTRAILIARNDGVEAKMPTPTHSRYYSRDPKRLDPGVLPWVSAAEGAGWDRDEVAGFARRADDKGAATADGYRERDLRPTDAPAQHVTEKARSWLRTSMGEPKVDGRNGSHVLDPEARPSHTVTTKAEAWVRSDDRPTEFMGHQYPNNKSPNKPNERQRRSTSEPVPTITSGSRSAKWVHDKPSSTIVGSFGADIIAGPGGSGTRPTDVSRHRQDRPGSVRVTLDEAAALQSYPPGFIFEGVPYVDDKGKPRTVSRTKAFLQVGNAVPPLLAEAIIASLNIGA